MTRLLSIALLTTSLAAAPAFAQDQGSSGSGGSGNSGAQQESTGSGSAAQESSGSGGGSGAMPEAQSVTMAGPDGSDRGSVSLVPTERGVLLEAQLDGLEPGLHAFHIHETGTCEGDFESAGGHYNPTGADHGYLAENGSHAGDMPNMTVAEDGTANFSVFNDKVRLDGGDAPLNDEDGSALMVHSGPDDYISQPSGDAGSRVACGVIYAAQ